VSRRPDQQQFLENLGGRLADARRTAGLTQAEVAERAGIDPQTVHRIEAAKMATSLLRLRDLAHAVGVELLSLLEQAPAARPENLELLTVWEQIPAERRELALRVLRDIARG
jgi:transcriptional regulator with XRE-family HTH domain